MSNQRKLLKTFTRPGNVSVPCGLAVAVLGIAVLAGWHAGITGIVRLSPTLVPMQYLTALCFLISGLGLASLSFRVPRLIPLFCGLLAGSAGLLITLENLSGWKLGIDLLIAHFPAPAGLVPGRPSQPTSAGFALCGYCLSVLSLPLRSRWRRLAVWILGSSALSLSLTAFFGYLLGFSVLFVSGSFIGMAFHTATGMTLLSVGLLAKQWTESGLLTDDPWLPVPAGFGTAAAAVMLWQAMEADRSHSLREQAQVVARSVGVDVLSHFKLAYRSLSRMKNRWEQRTGGTPYIEWRSDARAVIVDEPIFEAISRTDAAWRTEWVEPDAYASPLTGLDLHAEKRWNAVPALQQAVKTRKPVISPTLDLRPGEKGFLIYQPMFPGGEFDGFVFGVFRLGSLKESTLDEPALAICRIAVFEGDQFILGEPPLNSSASGCSAESSIEFRGRVWRFVAEPRSATDPAVGLPVVTLWLGLLLAGATAAAVRGFQQAMLRHRSIRSANMKLQEEINERMLAERQLRESEERLGLVLDSATGVSVIAADRQGLITYFSKGAERLLGYSAGEMVGRDVGPLIHDPAELEQRAAELTRELGYEVTGIETFAAIPRLKGSERREWTYLRSDGARLTVDLMVTVLRNAADGEATGYLGTAVDITERKQMERELRETLLAKKTSQALLESAGRIAQLGHWELPLDGNGPRWSDITCGIHEVPPGTVVSLDEALNFYHPEDRAGISQKVRDCMETGTVYEFEGRLLTAKGRQIWIYSRGEPMRDDTGKITALHGIFQDIDERYRAAELLKQRNVELEAATTRAEAHARAKTEFLANMSHEIRTPLNAVIGMSELLMDGELEPREREFVETIHSSGDVLLSLISDILDFSKIESGQLDLEHIPLSLTECVESVMDLLAGPAARKKLDLMHWIDPAVPDRVLGDPTRLRQVLVNLTSNAIKFTDQGEVFLHLSVREGVNGPLLHASVRDTGIGIAPEQMDRLFGVFSQVDASTTRRFGGTGLGLAISRRLIQNMGGDIQVESVEGKGSTFHFGIPLRPCGGAVSPVSPPPRARSLEGLKVLIVDDNETNRWILRMQTQSWKMLPTTVESARQALTMLQEGHPFDLAILDVMMPEMDGYELATEIRRSFSEHQLPILVLTSMGDLNRDAPRLGISGVLTKPVKTTALLATLRGILTRSSARPKAEPLPAGGGTPGDFSPLRILVAEDNPVNQRVTALHLLRLGYRPVMVANGLEVLEAMENSRFDVLLLDVQMPLMDGLETAREICRRHPPENRPWIVALTANAFDSDKEECLAAGMNDYLSKPVRSGSLQIALQAAFARTVPS